MNSLIKDTIQKQLLSFDDIEFDKSTDTNQKVSKTIKDWQWVQDNFVDLGLPSGTLWGKYNLGATNRNTAESWYGDYYMWGSTKPNTNDECCWINAPFNDLLPNGDHNIINKQNYVKGDNNLLLEYDAAFQMNNLICMPSDEQLNELISLPNKWVETYKGINRLSGRLFIGTNGNKLFIPATGFRRGRNVNNQRFFCGIWSSRLYHGGDFGAFFLHFDIDELNIICYERCCGLSIRPVLR